jgi:hypothetical protein
MTTLADLHAELDEMQRLGVDAAYYAKQCHRIPDAPVIERIPYIVARCKGQRVLNLGSSSGILHDSIRAEAMSVIGVDHEPGPQTDTWLDLDDYLTLHTWEIPAVDLIVAGELIEHLGNPGYLISRLRQAPGQPPLLITTPNAYAAGGIAWAKQGYENINVDHQVIFSWFTLDRLLHTRGWEPQAWAGYNGTWPIQEGLICIAR